jgi:hypothetical protein
MLVLRVEALALLWQTMPRRVAIGRNCAKPREEAGWTAAARGNFVPGRSAPSPMSTCYGVLQHQAEGEAATRL